MWFRDDAREKKKEREFRGNSFVEVLNIKYDKDIRYKYHT